MHHNKNQIELVFIFVHTIISIHFHTTSFSEMNSNVHNADVARQQKAYRTKGTHVVTIMNLVYLLCKEENLRKNLFIPIY